MYAHLKVFPMHVRTGVTISAQPGTLGSGLTAFRVVPRKMVGVTMDYIVANMSTAVGPGIPGNGTMASRTTACKYSLAF